MTGDEENLRKLLDGELSSEELSNDPILAKLAERIYGEDFLEQMGISRGESKRALIDTLEDDIETESLIEIIPGPAIELPEPEPFTPPMQTGTPESEGGGKVMLYSGGGLLVVTLLNLFGALSFIGSSCTGGGCPVDGHNKLNWLSFYRYDTGWGWSPTLLDGAIGIPDIALLIASFFLLFTWFLKR